MNIRSQALIATVLLTAAAQPALAQSSGSSSMDAQAVNSVNVMAVTGPQTYMPQRQEVDYSGHTWTTPSVSGSYFGGTNPCLVGTGGGAAGGPIAFSLNMGKSDEGCTRRSEAAAWHALGFDNVAVARLCQDREAADAFFAATGTACPGTGGSRYRTANGEMAPEAKLVASSRALPDNPYSGLDMSNAKVQDEVRKAALAMIKQNPQLLRLPATQPEMKLSPPRQPSFEEKEKEEVPVPVPIPSTTGSPS